MFVKFLSRNQPVRDYYFSVPCFCLRTLGFWPEHQKSFRSNCWAITNFIILFVGVLTELHAGITALRQHKLEIGLDTLCPAGTSAITLLKMLLISYYSKDLLGVMERMEHMLFGQKQECKLSILQKFNSEKLSLNTVKMAILRSHAILNSRFNFLPFLMGFITCSAYNVKPLLLALILWLQNKPITWLTPFNMTMPPTLLRAPFFPLTYIFTAYTGYVTIFFFAGCDSFFFEFCSHIAALMKMLQADVHEIFRKHRGKFQLNSIESLEVEAELIALIERHAEIIELTHYFSKRYAIITLAHFVSASMVIGVSIFDLLTYSGLGRIIYIAYTMAALSQLIVYCYGGTMVAESSTQLGMAVYACDWHICNPKLRRMILLIIIRAQHTLNIKVPFFSPSLSTFASILQTSGSIIALASSFR